MQYYSILIAKKREKEKKEGLTPVYSHSHGFNAILYVTV
jgi:hypothetical protein